MATEILGFLIIVGILIVFIVRRDLWNGPTASNKAEEVEEASVKMRLQMEHSADAIITRMESHIHQLENLVAAADERARILEKQLATVREDQERAQRKAEQEIAAMRAAQASYYPPRDDAYAAGYDDAMRRQSWQGYDGYRARMPQTQYSMRPINEVSSVRRPDYPLRERVNSRERDEGFAEALSASMYAAQNAYGNVPRGDRFAPSYYGDGAYERRGYDNNQHYGTTAYHEEQYPAEEETWEQYVEEPRRPAQQRTDRGFRRSSDVPVEMVVEETPAVIVEPRMTERREDYLREEPEEEAPVFSPEQMEELAKTEAEVVVSSSVADVVDLPIQPDGEDASEDVHHFAEMNETEPTEEDVHGFAESEETETPTEDAHAFEDAETGPEPTEERNMPYSEPEEENEAEIYLFEDGKERETGSEEETPSEVSAEEQIRDSEYDGTGDSQHIPEEAAVALPEESQDETSVFEGEEEISAPLETTEGNGGNLDGFFGDEPFMEDDAEESESGGEKLLNDSRQSSTPTARARELLEQGMSPADAARETGMGRSAVELLAQMAQSNRKTQDGD